jgi:hypothetical protein
MATIPFKKFIITFLLFSKDIQFIINKLKEFGYFITETQVVDIFNELKVMLPESLKELIESKGIFDSTNEIHAQWLKQLGVFEFYDFILRRDIDKTDPRHFHWCDNCLWINKYKDIMCLVNILLFNNDSVEEICDIISFKYKKKIGVDTLELYKRMFWETENLTAKDALEYCIPFRDNMLIVKKMRGGDTEVHIREEMDDGADVPITFHNTNYIKWKIGYNKTVEVPTAKDFLSKVKTDSYYKYYEAMNMTKSIQVEEEDGVGQFGDFNQNNVLKKNVEEQRVKMAKGWFDIFLKANEAMPESGEDTKSFFDKMGQLELDFTEGEEEKIARIQDMPEVLGDIKGDLS